MKVMYESEKSEKLFGFLEKGLGEEFSPTDKRIDFWGHVSTGSESIKRLKVHDADLVHDIGNIDGIGKLVCVKGKGLTLYDFKMPEIGRWVIFLDGNVYDEYKSKYLGQGVK
jgi:hypothetical protein